MVRGRRRRSLVLVLAVVLVIPILSACTVPTLTEATISLKPSLVQTQRSWSRGWNSFITCSYTSGLALFEKPTSPEVPLGYAHSYDDSFCWERYGESHRVLIQFDLSELAKLESKVIVSADLQLKERVIVMRASDGDAIRTSGTPSCIGPWSLPDADPRTGNGFAGGGEYRFEKRVEGPVFRITGLASSWVTGSAPNTGILFRPQEEDIKVEDDAACVSALSDFRLVVTYRGSSLIGAG